MGDNKMEETKNRHGCLTAWLVLLIITNSITALSNLLNILRGDMFVQLLQNPAYTGQIPAEQLSQIQMLLNTPLWVFYVSIALATFNVVCAVALFMWKKWGFWGFCVSSILAVIINLMYFSKNVTTIIISIISGLLAVLILFGVLHIGKKNKGWPQLK
jgi:ABC-type proline/glycine betaine transport system permease subunit